jgi:GMP synthase-like glutamine amidotransferase
MRRALVLKQVAHEGPARLATALERAGFELEVRELSAGATVPTTLEGYDALIALGAPLGVEDAADARFSYLARELELLKLAIARDFPTLGVCLGSQLLAAAAGARVYPNVVGEPPQRHREVGWGAVHFTEAPEREPVLRGLGAAELMFHWHGDTFELPANAQLLASTLPCKNQLYRIGRHVFGVQFHPELEQHDIEDWLERDPEYVRSALGPGGPERVAAETRRYFSRYRERGDVLVGNLVNALAG